MATDGMSCYSAVNLLSSFGVVWSQLHRQMDEVADRVKSRQAAHSDSLESGQSQRQMDLEVELLERKVRLFVGRAELIGKRDHGTTTPSDVAEDVAAVRDKWNSLLKTVDEARRVDAENDRLRRQAAEVDLLTDLLPS